jgi:hypothetical protein
MKKFYQKGSRGQKQKGGYIGGIKPWVDRSVKKISKWF